MPNVATSRAWKNSLTPSQAADVQQRARSTVANFQRPQTTPTPPPPVVAAPPAKPTSGADVYNHVFKNLKTGQYLYVDRFNHATQYWTVRSVTRVAKNWANPDGFVRGAEKVVGPNFFEVPGEHWQSIVIDPCPSCGGSGTIVTRTSVPYSYTETGIYNKYEYSGTRIDEKKSRCGCSGGESERWVDIQPKRIP